MDLAISFNKTLTADVPLYFVEVVKIRDGMFVMLRKSAKSITRLGARGIFLRENCVYGKEMKMEDVTVQRALKHFQLEKLIEPT